MCIEDPARRLIIYPLFVDDMKVYGCCLSGSLTLDLDIAGPHESVKHVVCLVAGPLSTPQRTPALAMNIVLVNS